MIYWWQDWTQATPENTRFIGSSTIDRMPLYNLDGCGTTRALGFDNGTVDSLQRYVAGANFAGLNNIVIYIGENDIAQGQSVEQVWANLQQLVQYIDTHSSANIGIMLVKYSPARARFHEDYKVLNALIKKNYKDNVSINTIAFNSISSRRFYVGDGVHLNAYGYQQLFMLITRFCDN